MGVSILNFPYYKTDNSHFFFNSTLTGSSTESDITVRTKSQIPSIEAFHRVFETITLVALYTGTGFLRRDASGRGGHGGYFVDDEEYQENKLKPIFEEKIKILQNCHNPFQIQAGFTLSKACAVGESEATFLEYFKIIELYIKYLAYNKSLSQNAINQIICPHPSLFNRQVKNDLGNFLDADIIELIWMFKELRGIVVGHGGVRPEIHMHLNDPEDNFKKVTEIFQKYNYDAIYNETFYEVIKFDVRVIALILFSRITGLPNINYSNPGCWSMPTKRILDISSKIPWEGGLIEYYTYDNPNDFFIIK